MFFWLGPLFVLLGVSRLYCRMKLQQYVRLSYGAVATDKMSAQRMVVVVTAAAQQCIDSLATDTSCFVVVVSS